MFSQAIASRKILAGSLLALFTLSLPCSWAGSGAVGFARWEQSWTGCRYVLEKKSTRCQEDFEELNMFC